MEVRYISTTGGLYLLFSILGHLPALSQTGTGAEPIRYLGGVYVDQDVHDGRLRPAVGVESYQVTRANRTHPDLGDGFGWTYGNPPDARPLERQVLSRVPQQSDR